VRPSHRTNQLLERRSVPQSTETKTATNFTSMAPQDFTTTNMTTLPPQQKQRPQPEQQHQHHQQQLQQPSQSSDDGTDQWWESRVNELAKPWTSWTARTSFLSSLSSSGLPVHSPTNNGDTTTNDGDDHNNKSTTDPFQWCVVPGSPEYHPLAGLYFVKVPKAGSSTCAAVSLQIARNVATRQQQQNYNNTTSNSSNVTIATSSSRSCNLRFHHGFHYAHRQPPFFLWTVIRHPVSRLISQYFFSEISRGRKTPSARAMMAFADRHVNFQLAYIRHLESHGNQPRYNIQEIRQRSTTTKQQTTTTRTQKTTPSREEIVFLLQKDVMNVYHLIAVAERMEESMVVLQLLFQLEPMDMIVLPSKQKGGYDDGAYNKTCNWIQPPVSFPEVDVYLHQDFYVDNYDFFLHAVVNRSLDLTIDALGRDLVERQVQHHKALQAYAVEQCQSQAIFPCSNNGTWQREASSKSCFHGDNGCGYKCVHKALAEYQQKQ
jgi:hypothetical protein